MLAALCAGIALLGPNKTSKQPGWMEHTIAGYAFAYDQNHLSTGVYDKKKGFYLIREVECDGGILKLILTRDRKVVRNEGFAVSIEGENDPDKERELLYKPLPSLSTGKGVSIGDSEARVEQILGKPTQRNLSGSRNQFIDLEYRWQEGKKGEGRVFSQTYTFKQGKLIEIAFDRNSDEM